MDQRRHDGIAMDYIDVTCADCGTRDADIISDLRNQRDAAEKERDASQLALAKSQTRAAQLLWTAKYIAKALRSLRHAKLDGIAEQYGLRTNGYWLGLFLDATHAHAQALGDLAVQRERAAAAERRAAAAEAEVERLRGQSCKWSTTPVHGNLCRIRTPGGTE